MKNLVIGLGVFGLFCTLLVATNAESTLPQNVIKSDWKLEDPNAKKKPVSMLELSTHEEKIADLKEEQKQAEEKLQLDIQEIKAKKLALIDCMSDKGVLLFTSEDKACKECTKQRELFGDELEVLKKKKIYINCDTDKFTCPFRSVKYYPTWYLGKYLGIKKEGMRELPKLAKMTDCEW